MNARELAESIVCRYASPRGEVCCRAEDLIADFTRQFEMMEREIENERQQAEAWKRILAMHTEPRGFWKRLFSI